jgi:hypothetical protein
MDCEKDPKSQKKKRFWKHCTHHKQAYGQVKELESGLLDEICVNISSTCSSETSIDKLAHEERKNRHAGCTGENSLVEADNVMEPNFDGK